MISKWKPWNIGRFVKGISKWGYATRHRASQLCPWKTFHWQVTRALAPFMYGCDSRHDHNCFVGNIVFHCRKIDTIWGLRSLISIVFLQWTSAEELRLFTYSSFHMFLPRWWRFLCPSAAQMPRWSNSTYVSLSTSMEFNRVPHKKYSV